MFLSSDILRTLAIPCREHRPRCTCYGLGDGGFLRNGVPVQATLWTSFEYARVGCVETLPFYYSISITGFITDLLILVSPLPLVHKLPMPLKSRIAVPCILLLGAVYATIPLPT
ncbi:hypothetical protein F4680DRAFT_114541 [Xylaria scruposa]|nr:hypothetical protein F4680DRAFT_114541 [Xylaria scruposa]